MASQRLDPPTENEEIYLWWLFMKNVRAVRKRPKLFQRMYDQQRNVRAFLRLSYKEQTHYDRLTEVRQALEELEERFAFNGDISQDSGGPPEDDAESER